MLLSYHPLIIASENRLLVSQRPLNPGDTRAMLRAKAVCLPLICRQDLWELAHGLGLPAFPHQAARLALDGKVGALRLCAGLGLPHPHTLEFPDLAAAAAAWRSGELERAGLTSPLVAKGAGGGMGDNVFLVRGLAELEALAGRLETGCMAGPPGLVVQELVAAGGRDCRVVFIGPWEDVFWRKGADGEFRANLSQGGRVVRYEDRAALAACLEVARRLKAGAGLDVAAVDLVVCPQRGPLVLEVNHYFGREAIGGAMEFDRRFLQAVRAWLEGLGLDPALARQEKHLT